MMSSSAVRILVVDDELPVRMSLGGYFEDRGFAVLLAESAEEALDILARETVDLVIVDIRLPGMDGNALVLEAHQRQPSTSFLIYTGSTSYRLPENLKAIGVHEEDVFHKPLADMSVMAEATRRHMRGEKEA
jgi:DNA-binding NtrC family response regulator